MSHTVTRGVMLALRSFNFRRVRRLTRQGRSFIPFRGTNYRHDATRPTIGSSIDLAFHRESVSDSRNRIVDKPISGNRDANLLEREREREREGERARECKTFETSH